MAHRPSVPLENHLAPRLRRNVRIPVLRGLMTYNIRSGELRGRNKSVVEVICLPACSRWDGILVLHFGVPSRVPFSVDNDAGYMAVGGYERKERSEEGEVRERSYWSHGIGRREVI